MIRFIEQGWISQSLSIDLGSDEVRISTREIIRQGTERLDALSLLLETDVCSGLVEYERIWSDQLEWLLHLHATILSRRRLRKYASNITFQQRTKDPTGSTQQGTFERCSFTLGRIFGRISLVISCSKNKQWRYFISKIRSVSSTLAKRVIWVCGQRILPSRKSTLPRKRSTRTRRTMQMHWVKIVDARECGSQMRSTCPMCTNWSLHRRVETYDSSPYQAKPFTKNSPYTVRIYWCSLEETTRCLVLRLKKCANMSRVQSIEHSRFIWSSLFDWLDRSRMAILNRRWSLAMIRVSFMCCTLKIRSILYSIPFDESQRSTNPTRHHQRVLNEFSGRFVGSSRAQNISMARLFTWLSSSE